MGNDDNLNDIFGDPSNDEGNNNNIDPTQGNSETEFNNVEDLKNSLRENAQDDDERAFIDEVLDKLFEDDGDIPDRNEPTTVEHTGDDEGENDPSGEGIPPTADTEVRQEGYDSENNNDEEVSPFDDSNLPDEGGEPEDNEDEETDLNSEKGDDLGETQGYPHGDGLDDVFGNAKNTGDASTLKGDKTPKAAGAPGDKKNDTQGEDVQSEPGGDSPKENKAENPREASEENSEKNDAKSLEDEIPEAESNSPTSDDGNTQHGENQKEGDKEGKEGVPGDGGNNKEDDQGKTPGESEGEEKPQGSKDNEGKNPFDVIGGGVPNGGRSPGSPADGKTPADETPNPFSESVLPASGDGGANDAENTEGDKPGADNTQGANSASGRKNKDGSSPDNNQVVNSPDFDNAGLQTPARGSHGDNTPGGDEDAARQAQQKSKQQENARKDSATSPDSAAKKKAKMAAGAAIALVLMLIMTLGMMAGGMMSNINNNVIAANQPANVCGEEGTMESSDSSADLPGGSLRVDGDIAIPTTGTFTSPFGPRWGGFHPAIDIADPEGTPIYAAHSGTVIASGPASGYGLWLRIQSDEDPGLITQYGHMEKIHESAQVGDHVEVGQLVTWQSWQGGVSPPGPAGTHLDFVVEKDGEKIDPVAWFKDNGIDFPAVGGRVELNGAESGGGSSGGGGSRNQDSGRDSEGGSSRETPREDSDGDSGDSSDDYSNEKGADTILVGDSITSMAVREYHGATPPAPGVEYLGRDTNGGRMPNLRIDARGSRMFRDEGYNKLKSKINDPANSNVKVVVIATVSNDPLKESEQKFKEIIDLAHSKGMKVVTLTTSQIDGGEGQTQAYKDLYEGNNEVVRNSDADIIIDWKAETEGKDELFTDFIHPNGQGIKLLVDLMQEAVSKAKDGQTGVVGGDGSTEGGGDKESGDEYNCVCTPENADSTNVVSSDAGGATDPNAQQEKYAKMAIALGKKFGLSDDEIITTIMTIAAESTFNNLPSDKWPESKRYTTEGQAAGDHNSVGIVQQQVAFGAGATEVGQGGGWLPGSTMEEYMTPAYQLGSFMYKLKEKTDSSRPKHFRAQDVQASACVSGHEHPTCNGVRGGNYLEHEELAKDLFSKYKGSAGSPSSEDSAAAQKSWDRMKALLGGGGSGSSDSESSGSSGSSGSSSSEDKKMDCSGNPSSSDNDRNTNRAGSIAEKAVEIALEQKGKPYVWGAVGPDSFDCSGLIYYSYREAGIESENSGYTMPRNTTAQLAAGKSISRDDIAPGDIIITNGGGHALMYIGDNEVVEAQQSGVPVLTRSFDEINDIVDIRRIIDENDKLIN